MQLSDHMWLEREIFLATLTSVKTPCPVNSQIACLQVNVHTVGKYGMVMRYTARMC